MKEIDMGEKFKFLEIISFSKFEGHKISPAENYLSFIDIFLRNQIQHLAANKIAFVFHEVDDNMGSSLLKL